MDEVFRALADPSRRRLLDRLDDRNGQAEADLTTALPSRSADAYTLETELGEILRALKIRYPSLREVFLSSRTYGGYAATILNPEPYAYESVPAERLSGLGQHRSRDTYGRQPSRARVPVAVPARHIWWHPSAVAVAVAVAAHLARQHLGVSSVVAGTEASNAACVAALVSGGFVPDAGPPNHQHHGGEYPQPDAEDGDACERHGQDQAAKVSGCLQAESGDPGHQEDREPVGCQDRAQRGGEVPHPACQDNPGGGMGA